MFPVGITLLIIEFICTPLRRTVVGPFSACSPNSVHGSLSRVQNAKGISANLKGCHFIRYIINYVLIPSDIALLHVS